MADVKFVLKQEKEGSVLEVEWDIEQATDGIYVAVTHPSGRRFHVARFRPDGPLRRYGGLPLNIGLPLDDEGRVLVE